MKVTIEWNSGHASTTYQGIARIELVDALSRLATPNDGNILYVNPDSVRLIQTEAESAS